MRPALLFISVMALCLLVIPMIATSYDIEPAGTAQTAAVVHSPPVQVLEDSYPPAGQQAEDGGEALYAYENDEECPLGDAVAVASAEPVSVFRVLDQSSGKIIEISLEDFVRGAVAAEMPASFHSEALKAQAVAAHTFAVKSRIAQENSPDAGLMGADFAADPSNMKVYITEEKAKEFYGGGELADSYWNKVRDAADSVMQYILEYDDEPIVAAYHAISAGKTEDASNVWSGSAPYLVSVESQGDILAPGFETTVTMTAEEVKSKLLEKYPNMELASDPSVWFGEIMRSDTGYVSDVVIGDRYFAGKDLRQMFELRSHNFEVSFADGIFIFTVTGYGHGVGLSQYGADFLARQGYTFDEILAVYYSGAELKAVA